MPELPEVETIKEALKKAVEGAIIQSVVVRNRRFRKDIPEDFEKRLASSRICKIYRIAKYIIFDIDTGISIIWHLGMSGKVKICSQIPENLDKHDHVIFSTTLGGIIYNDVRRFGLLTYVKTENLHTHQLFEHLGKEPFDETLTVQYLKQRFKNKAIPIKVALLDQSIINGIGNIYASESLFEASISPLRQCSDISDDELDHLIEAIKKTLNKAIIAGGSTLRDYRKPDGSIGYFQNQHCVYNKTGKRCPNCVCNTQKTGGIKRIVQAGRSTFYCERLQK